MRRIWFTFFLILFSGLILISVQAQSHLQSYVDELKFGKMKLRDLKLTFGEPDSKKKISSWMLESEEDEKTKLYLDASSTQFAKPHLKELIRNSYHLEYKRHGLVFTFFDNPSELIAFKITNPDISLMGLKVGDDLAKVKRVLGENDEWWTTKSSDNWVLEYEKLGVEFYFTRDEKAPKYPMKLDKKKKIIRMERFNKNIVFAG